MRRLTSMGFSSTSKPATVAVPEVGGRKQVRIRMVVVLPAPFGPRKPTIWPFWTSNEMSSTAVLRAYLLVRPLTVIIDFYSRVRDVQQGNHSSRNSSIADKQTFMVRRATCVVNRIGRARRSGSGWNGPALGYKDASAAKHV